MAAHAPAARRALCGGMLILACGAGCASSHLNAARYQFYQGNFALADSALSSNSIPEADRVLYLMERGMARQMRGDYVESSRDFIEAADTLYEMAPVSVSQKTGSFVVNDTVESFKGAPFERSLLHAFTAFNHFAAGTWDSAAVEARRMLNVFDPERLGQYPQDAFSRYVAGFSFEMIDDTSSAAQQYAAANELVPAVGIDARGHLGPAATGAPAPPAELVCFIMAGRARSDGYSATGGWRGDPPIYAEIYDGASNRLGRSYVLADTVDLSFRSEEAEATMTALKTGSRVAVKEGVSTVLESQQEGLGDLARFVLIGLLEQPDNRRWETLPRWLSVARCPCPADLQSFDVVFKQDPDATLRRLRVERPLMRRRNTFIAFCRDIEAAY